MISNFLPIMGTTSLGLYVQSIEIWNSPSGAPTLKLKNENIDSIELLPKQTRFVTWMHPTGPSWHWELHRSVSHLHLQDVLKKTVSRGSGSNKIFTVRSVQLRVHGFAASVCAQVGPEVNWYLMKRTHSSIMRSSVLPSIMDMMVNFCTVTKPQYRYKMKMQNLLTGTRNSHGSILKVVMETNEVTVTFVDVVWKKLTFQFRFIKRLTKRS